MTRQSQRGVTLMELLVAITLLSLLSVGMLFAMRVGLDAMGKTNNRMISNRRVLGVDRILTEQIAGFIPVKADCLPAPGAPPIRVAFFQGEPQTMRFVSTFSLNEASRSYPQILEFQVIPRDNGPGVRLIVNEWLYTGPLSTGASCTGVAPEPGGRRLLFRPVEAGPHSFVLADNLARCEFSYKEEIPDPELPDFWRSVWVRERTPAAVRIDLAPLEPDPAKLQMPSIVAPFRTTRDPLTVYYDYK